MSKFRAWVALLVLLIILIGVKSYWNFLQSPADLQGQVRAFVIQRGESISSISTRLHKEGLIRSSFAFKVNLKLSGNASNIEAGDFKLSPSMSMEEVIKSLQSGSADKWVTLVEGWRVEEMAVELNSKFQIPNDKFITIAKKQEGYLFPDTYLINPDATPEDIVAILRNNFDKKYDEELQNKVNKLGLTPKQGVILASIVEREARSDEVRRMVASILLKRFKINMGLQADATLQYTLGYQKEEKSWWKRHLTKEDLKVESPYNTYLYAGFPPAPISNPSLSSLQAVANADPSTPYLYYYHDSKGNSHYGKTLEDHSQNIANNP